MENAHFAISIIYNHPRLQNRQYIENPYTQTYISAKSKYIVKHRKDKMLIFQVYKTSVEDFECGIG